MLPIHFLYQAVTSSVGASHICRDAIYRISTLGYDLEKSRFYIFEMHPQVLTQSQDSTQALDQQGNIFNISLIRGDWKRQPNNPLRSDGTIHEYCPPEQVTSEMDRLMALHHQHGEQKIPPEIEAAWLHHRFTQIHPFQDGNGRVARCLASLVFIQASWFPLVVTRDDRAVYIAALEDADRGDLSSLINLFAKSQKSCIFEKPRFIGASFIRD